MRKVISLITLLLLATTARAMIEVGGTEKATDRNWPAGSVELANLKTRVGWWEGPPFGGGERQFLYRGDTAAFQQALDLFAKIRAPHLELIVHEGPQENPFLEKDKRVDWTFTVWDPRSFHHLYDNPQSHFSARDPNSRYRQNVDPPRMDVYVADDDGKGIDFAKVKPPATIHVRDERATANGYAAADGSVVRGDVYDMITSKPIAGVTVALMKYDGKKDWQRAAETKSDTNGHFEMKNAPPGSFQVTATADGYAARSLGYVTLGKNTLKQFDDGIYLVAPEKITGVVKDTDDKPIAGATVRVDLTIAPDGRGYVLPDKLETTTDDQGRFELAGLPAGHAQLHVAEKSHQMLDVLKLIAVPSKDVALRMTATGAIEGRVTKANGAPAADAQVDVEPIGDPIGKWGGGTNVKPDGTFRFENVPPGTYTISAKPGMARIRKDPTAKQIEVKAGETLKVELTK